ncbi:MAG: 50S ribosomal protein L29 [Clostridiales bacterium]|jgi:large subunit ribosomal protein L29|nr:50S ribosomal protein L29 [Clostridiales bacterium]
MKSKELFVMNNDELISKLNSLKAELYALRFKHATNQLTNPLVIRDTKHDIAKIKTILRQRELNISVEPKTAAEVKSAKKSK